MDPLIVIFGMLMTTLIIFVLMGERMGKISPWLGFGIVSLAAGISGLLFVYLSGDPLVGALCMSPLLAFVFGVPVLGMGFVLRPKKEKTKPNIQQED